MHTIHGESGAISQDTSKNERLRLKEITKDFAPEDVFNADETALFYQLEPKKTLASSKVNGTKQSKPRITVKLVSNSNGTEKCRPLVLSRARRHQCFIPPSFGPNAVVDYDYNKKAWQTAETFEKWVKLFNQRIRFKNPNRKVLLLLDNTKGHADIELTNLKIAFLSPNLTSVIQSMDARIIRSFKAKYKKLLAKYLLKSVEDFKMIKLPTAKASLYLIEQAWDEILGK